MNQVWDRTAEFLSDNLGPVIAIAMIFIFVPASIDGSLAALAQEPNSALAIVVRVIALALAIVALIGQLGIIALVLEPGLGRDAWRTGLARLPQALIVLIVMLAAMVALLLPVAGILAATGYDLAARIAGANPSVPPATAAMIGLYLLFVLPLMLWAFSRLAVATTVVVAERAGLGALARSIQLTRGNSLAIIGVVLLYLFVSFVAVLAAQTAFGSIFALIAGRSDGGMSLAQVLTSVLVATVRTIFAVLAAAFLARLYQALAQRAGALQPQ